MPWQRGSTTKEKGTNVKKKKPAELADEIYGSDQTNMRFSRALHKRLDDILVSKTISKSRAVEALVADFVRRAEEDEDTAIIDLFGSMRQRDELLEELEGEVQDGE